MTEEINKKSKPGLFKSILVGVGCFLVYLFVFTIIIGLFGFYIYSYPYKYFSSPVILPSLSLPEQNDFISLQEKILYAKANEKKQIELTLAEYNAYLNKIKAPLEYGYFLQKVRFNIEKGKKVYYLVGSGYMQRTLNVRLEYSNNPNKPDFVSWNKFQIPTSGITKFISDKLLNLILRSGNTSTYKLIVEDNFPEIKENKIVINLQ